MFCRYVCRAAIRKAMIREALTMLLCVESYDPSRENKGTLSGSLRSPLTRAVGVPSPESATAVKAPSNLRSCVEA